MSTPPAATLSVDQARLLGARYPQWGVLDDDEQERAEYLIEMFRRYTNLEILPGVEPTPDIEITVAAANALLLLGLPIDRIPHLSSVIIHPRSVQRQVVRRLGGLMVSESRSVLSGQAHPFGPVLISWGDALREMRQPERGRQVIIHELAHKLDMANSYDGVPPIAPESRPDFVAVRDRELRRIRAGEDDGTLDFYAGTDAGEFFAVTAEKFLTDPAGLANGLPELYQMMVDAMGQDPARRLGRGRY